MKRLVPPGVIFVLALSLVVPNAGFADYKKKDPDEIGNRDVGKGINFYSL